MYVILAAATAGAIAPTTGIGVRNLIGRNGHRIDAANQLGGLRLLVGSNERVLSRLRSLELQALVFSRQSSDLVLGQEVQDRAAVGIGVVDDVAGAGLDGVAGIASLSCHVVPDTVNAPLRIAAALRQLGAEGYARLTASELEDLLLRYTGLSLADMSDAAFDGLTYLADFDAYYGPAGDAGYVRFQYGYHSPDGTVTLRYAGGSVTLHQDAGRWLVISNVLD